MTTGWRIHLDQCLRHPTPLQPPNCKLPLLTFNQFRLTVDLVCVSDLTVTGLPTPWQLTTIDEVGDAARSPGIIAINVTGETKLPDSCIVLSARI
jgi:hypothetical protein